MIDLQENTTRLIRPVAARSLVWRPDGKFLAMLSMRSRFSLDILVLNPDSGEIVNHSPLIAHELIIDSDQWKVMFPPAPGQLQSCIDPP